VSISDSVHKAQPGDEVWDKGEKGSVKGLHLRVSKTTGQKNWMVYYRTIPYREQRRPKIGDYPTLSLASARDVARDLLLRVAKGEDPSKANQLARGEDTVADVWELLWDEHYSNPPTTWSTKAKQIWEREIKPTFGARRVSAVTIDDVERWHVSYKGRPYQGNRALAVLRKLFNFAEKKRKKPLGSNPCTHVEMHGEEQRERYATDEEIALLGQLLAARKADNPAAAAFLYLMIYSGSRPSLIERAEWGHLSTHAVEPGVVAGILKLPGKKKRKTGKDDIVVVPPSVMELLAVLPRDTPTMLGITFPKKFWNKLRADAGCPDLWAYDLRRTWGTTAISEGLDTRVVQRLMNHETEEAARRYQHITPGSRIRAAIAMAATYDRKLNPATSDQSPIPSPLAGGQPSQSDPPAKPAVQAAEARPQLPSCPEGTTEPADPPALPTSES